MENRVNFREGMDIDPEDHNNLQSYAQTSLDHVVLDAITAKQRYSGFTVTKTGITSVGVEPGRLYSGGKRFAKTASTAQDFSTGLPLAGKRIVAVVVWGNEQDTGVTPREFLINEETGASEPRPVAMTKARLANVQFAQGADAPDPTPPIIDAGYTAVAYVTISTSGVEKIEMLTANRVENLDEIGDSVDSLNVFKSEAGPKISTLASDLAKLNNQLKASAGGALLERMLQRLAVLEYNDRIPTTAVDSFADYFLSPDQIDFTHPLSHCKVGEGLRFPDFNAAEAQLQIFDPLNPKVTIRGGTMFPAYDRELWLANTNFASEAQVAGFSYQSFSMVQKTMSRQRIRYGSEFTVCTNSTFWATGTYDYFTQTFRRGDEVFQTAQIFSYDNVLNFDASGNPIQHSNLRLKQIFIDNVEEPYWDKVTVDHTVNGAQIAETFLQGQDIWLDAVGLYFTRLANSGGCTVSICEVTKYGTPNLQSVISHTTLDRSQMLAYPLETVVPIQPTFLQAGKRYAILITTAADHWVGMTPGEDFTQGTFFYVLDGAYAQGDGTRDLMFKLYRSKFRSNRTVVELQTLSLAGGILSIDVNADVIQPNSTNLTYEIQPAGSGAWFNLLDIDSYMLGRGGSTPVTCNFRVVMAGSPDMMPALALSGSKVRVSRPDVTRVSVTKPKVMAAPSSTVHLLQRYENFDGNLNAVTAKLRTGAGYNTVVTPTSVITDTGVDEKGQPFLEAHYVFALGAPISSYCVQEEASTQSPMACFHTAWRKGYQV